MTNFVLNLSKHYNDLSVALPFWYDLMANQQLYLTKTSGHQLLPRIDKGLQEIKTQLSFTYSHQWRLIVLVEMNKSAHQNPYTASLYAKCLAIQDRLKKTLENSAMRAPKDILMIWLDSDNDEFIRYEKKSFWGQTIDFDHHGRVDSGEQHHAFFSPAFMQKIDHVWKKAKITTKGQNIEDLSQQLNTKVGQVLSVIQNNIHEVLDHLPTEDFILEKTLNIFPEAHLQDIRQAVQEEFLHTQNNPKEWNNFLPSRQVQDILKQKNSLFALPIRQQFTFIRVSIQQVLQDLIKLALLVRLVALYNDKILKSLRKEQTLLWKNLDLDKEHLAQILQAYWNGLREAKRELQQLKTAKSQLKTPIKQYKAPVFSPVRSNELPDFKIKLFRFSWFNHVQTLPDFLTWVAAIDQKLHQQRDAAPKLIEECHLMNTKKRQEEYHEEWNELESKHQLKDLQQQYDKAQQVLNNALQYPHIFQDWEEKKIRNEQIARDQFGKRPSKRVFFVSLSLAIMMLSIPFLFGWYYMQDNLTWWTIGVGTTLLVFFASWILYQIIQPIKQLIATLVESAKDTKKAIQLELKKQEYYIENIIRSAVLRKNIHQLHTELDMVQQQKQLLEYHIKEADYHIELINNLIKHLKLKSNTTSSTSPSINLQSEQLNQIFNKNSFSWLFDYLKEKEKLEVHISNTPIRLAEFDKLGVLVKSLSFQEDRTV